MQETTRTTDFTALSTRLSAHPALAARFAEVLDLVEGAGTDIVNAHKAEERAIEVLRGMGNEALHAWALRAAGNAATTVRDTGRVELHLKKK